MEAIEIEFHQLVLKYEELTVLEKHQLGKLLASIAEYGQQTPVLVVTEATNFILIDGYRRVRAMRKLGRDTVLALVAPMAETEALLYKHKLETPRRRSPLEEGWLIKELVNSHGLSRTDIAVRLSRSKSWVCRRIDLVSVLPESVQRKVRDGTICAYAATKYLVPLARANRQDCKTLIDNLGKRKLTARQFKQLYVALKEANKEQRRNILAKPLTAVKVAEELKRAPPISSSEDFAKSICKDIRIVRSVCYRIIDRLEQGGSLDQGALDKFANKWTDVMPVVGRLGSLLLRTKDNDR